jgi:pimeloyl-ACP methyl ester carboxylesterase
VLGYHTSSPVAVELAINRPKQVRRVVLVSVPLFTEAERESLRRIPPSIPAAADGSHLAAEWQRIAESYGAGVPIELVTTAFVEKLRNGPHPAWLTHAALQYPVRERLSLITQQVLLLRPRDDLWDATLRAREALPKSRCIDIAEQGPALFEVAPELVAEALRDFLRG